MRQTSTFEIKELLPVGLTLVVLGIGVAYGLNVMGDVKSDMCGTGHWFNASTGHCYEGDNMDTMVLHTTAQFNATSDTSTGVAKIPAKLPLIATVIVAVVIIGLLIRYLMVRY